MAVLAVPIVLICNLFRVLVYGLVTIYGHLPPLNPMPRYVSIVTSLLLAYGLFCLVLGILNQVIQNPDPTPGPATRRSVAD